MITLLSLLLALFAAPFRSKSRLVAENAALRHQLSCAAAEGAGAYPACTKWRSLVFDPAVSMVSLESCRRSRSFEPETLYALAPGRISAERWRWKSRSLERAGAQIGADVRALIRRMSVENPLWGAPRIHGELLKLGLEVAQSSVAKYMVKRVGPPSQGWSTFLRNHASNIAAMDLFSRSEH